MEHLADTACDFCSDSREDYDWSESELESMQDGCTAEAIADVCVEVFVVSEFLENGLAEGGCPLDVLKGGWGKFDLSDRAFPHRTTLAFRELIYQVTGVVT